MGARLLGEGHKIWLWRSLLMHPWSSQLIQPATLPSSLPWWRTSWAEQGRCVQCGTIWLGSTRTTPSPSQEVSRQGAGPATQLTSSPCKMKLEAASTPPSCLLVEAAASLSPSPRSLQAAWTASRHNSAGLHQDRPFLGLGLGGECTGGLQNET